MKSKTKNNKGPKSDQSRLSDLTPENDARGGLLKPDAVSPLATPAQPGASSLSKKHLIKLPPPSA